MSLSQEFYNNKLYETVDKLSAWMLHSGCVCR